MSGWNGLVNFQVFYFILTLDKKKITRIRGYLVGGSDFKISKAKIIAFYVCVIIFFLDKIHA